MRLPTNPGQTPTRTAVLPICLASFIEVAITLSEVWSARTISMARSSLSARALDAAIGQIRAAEAEADAARVNGLLLRNYLTNSTNPLILTYIEGEYQVRASKVLGTGEITVAVNVTADAFSGSAKDKIEAAGGSATTA